MFAVLTALSGAGVTYAQDNFPNKPIQIIVPTGPGGGTDTGSTSQTLAGTVAKGAAWTGVVVTAKCATGTYTSAPTTSTGAYSKAHTYSNPRHIKPLCFLML